MNPHAVHSSGHQMLQKILSEPIGNGPAGGFIVYANAQYPARVLEFMKMQMPLPAGGFTPVMAGTVIVSKSDLPANVNFKTGQLVQATDPAGNVFNCQIKDVSFEVTEFKLTLWDQAQGA